MERLIMDRKERFFWKFSILIYILFLIVISITISVIYIFDKKLTILNFKASWWNTWFIFWSNKIFEAFVLW